MLDLELSINHSINQFIDTLAKHSCGWVCVLMGEWDSFGYWVGKVT